MRIKKLFTKLFAVILFLALVPLTANAEGETVCTIGNNGFSTLTEAITRVQDGGTIVLTKDVIEAVTVTDSEKSFTLDLNGYSLGEEGGTVGGVLRVVRTKNLTIKNGTITEWSDGWSVVTVTSGTVIFDNVNVTQENEGDSRCYAIENNGGTVILRSGTFKTGDNKAVFTADSATTKLDALSGASVNWETKSTVAVRVLEPIIDVDGVSYADINNGVKEVKDGGTITLLKNVNNVAYINEGEKSFTLDLNGYLLGDESSSLCKPLWVQSVGELIVKNGQIKEESDGWSVVQVDKGTVIFDSVTVEQKDLVNGEGAIENTGGTVVLKAGTFIGRETALITASGATTKLASVSSATPVVWASANAVTVEVDKAASVNGAAYTTVADAIAAVEDGGTVVLEKTLSGISVDAGEKNFTLDLNDYLVGAENGFVYQPLEVQSAGILTVKNGRIAEKSDGCSVVMVNKGTVIFEDVEIEQLDTVNGKYGIENNGGTVILKSAEITGAEEAIYTAEGAVTKLDKLSDASSNWKTAVKVVVREKDPVITVDGVAYANLDNGIEAVEDGGTIILLKDVEQSAHVDVGEKSFTLDLDGYLLGTDNSRMGIPLWVKSVGTLTVKNGVIADACDSWSVVQVDDGKVIFEDVEIREYDTTNGDYGIENNGGKVVLKSGTFAGAIKAVYTAEGAETVLDVCSVVSPAAWEDAVTVTVSIAEPALDVDGVSYAQINRAIAAVKDGGTITLLKNIQDEAIVDVKWKSFTLDLNGYLLGTETGSMYVPLWVKSVGTLNVKNGVIADACDRWSVVQVDDGTVIFEDVEIREYDTTNGDYGIENNGGKVVLKSGTFAGAMKAVYTEDGALTQIDSESVALTEDWENATVFTVKKDLSQKTLTLSKSSYTYDGSAKKPSVTVSGVDKADYNVAYEDNVNAGTATVTVTGKGKYAGTLTKTFKIEKADMTGIKVSGKTVTYNGESHYISVSGIPSGAKVTYSKTEDGTYSTTKISRVSAGTTTVYYKVSKDNYNTVSGSAKITVKKADMTGIKVSGKTVTYNGKSHKITISGVPSGAKVTYCKTKSGTYTTTNPTRTSAGTTTVYYKITKSNYNTITGSAKITVNKRSISSATLSKTSYVYNGDARKPTVTVKNSSGTKLTKGTHYTVAYKNNTKVGKATVTITGKGNYKGTITKTFKINPKATSISSLTAASKAFTVKWKKVTTQTTGYQIMYATNSDFTKNKVTKTVTSNSTVSKKITGLKAKTTYYVKVRTYKTVNGTKYYSSWSTVEKIKTK